MRRPRMAAAVMLRTPAQLSYTSIALCLFAAGSSILFVSTRFIASCLSSEEVRPQGCKAAIAPRARRDSHALRELMTCGIVNMCCDITFTQQVAVAVVDLLRLSGKVDCSSGGALVNRSVCTCVVWHKDTSLSGKGIGAVSCVPCVERTSPNSRVSGCIRHGAGELHSNVHPGRCSPAGPTDPRFDRPSMPIPHRLSGTNRPPGARMDMICGLPAIMSGVACVGALQQHLMRVACNSGVVLVCHCRLFLAS